MASAFRYLLPAAVLLTGACNPVELPQPAETPSKIVLLGELVAGDTLQLRGGRSKSFASGTHSVPEFESGMQVRVSSSGAENALTPYEDELLYSVFTTLFSNPAIVRAQTGYTIRASRPGLNAVEAAVQVPAAFNGTTAAAGPVVYKGDSMLAFDVTLDGMPQGSRYVFEVLRSPVSIENRFFYKGMFRDLDQERRLYDSLIRAGVQVDLQHDTSTSKILTRQPFYSDRSSAENTSPGAHRSYHWFFLDAGGKSADRLRLYIPIAATRDSAASNHRFIFRLKSVAPDYYTFLKGYELGNLQPGGSNGKDLTLKPTTASGNVRGGMGIVGGVYLRESQFVY